MSKKNNRNFVISGHGSYIAQQDNKYKLSKMHFDDINVITLAPPYGTCFYPPDFLEELPRILKNKKAGNIKLSSFWNKIKKIQIKTLGVPYCDKEWIDSFAKENNFDASKICNIQKQNIIRKSMSFIEEGLSFLGVWDVTTNTKLELPSLSKEDHGYYSFELILNILKEKYPNTIINILDCTCNAIYDNTLKVVDDIYELQQEVNPTLRRADSFLSNGSSPDFVTRSPITTPEFVTTSPMHRSSISSSTSNDDMLSKCFEICVKNATDCIRYCFTQNETTRSKKKSSKKSTKKKRE